MSKQNIGADIFFAPNKNVGPKEIFGQREFWGPKKMGVPKSVKLKKNKTFLALAIYLQYGQT